MIGPGPCLDYTEDWIFGGHFEIVHSIIWYQNFVTVDAIVL